MGDNDPAEVPTPSIPVCNICLEKYDNDRCMKCFE